MFHATEVGVAGAKADGDIAFRDETEADNTARVVARPDQRLRVGIEAVLLREIRTDTTNDPPRLGQWRQLRIQPKRGGFERIGVPCLRLDVHQVHPRAVTVIDGGDCAGEDGCHE